jgi:hypothetical protein
MEPPFRLFFSEDISVNHFTDSQTDAGGDLRPDIFSGQLAI